MKACQSQRNFCIWSLEREIASAQLRTARQEERRFFFFFFLRVSGNEGRVCDLLELAKNLHIGVFGGNSAPGVSRRAANYITLFAACQQAIYTNFYLKRHAYLLLLHKNKIHQNVQKEDYFIAFFCIFYLNGKFIFFSNGNRYLRYTLIN